MKSLFKSFILSFASYCCAYPLFDNQSDRLFFAGGLYLILFTIVTSIDEIKK